MSAPPPSISVVILCHNHEAYIEDCVLSVLNQDYEGDFDIVIGDDASTDRSCERIEQLLATHPRGKQATLIKHPKNLNVSGNCYHTTAHACGRYIIRCDGDDVQRHDRVRELVRLLTLYPEARVFSSQHSFIDGEGHKSEHREQGEPRLERHQPRRHFGRIDIIWGCVSMWDRAIIEELGDFSAGKPDDMVLSYRAYLMGCDIAHSPKALVYYRQHGGNMCNIDSREQRDYKFSQLFVTAHAQMMLDTCTHYNRQGAQGDYKETDYNLHQAYLALRKVLLHPHAEYENHLPSKLHYVLCACRTYPWKSLKFLLRLLPSPLLRLYRDKLIPLLRR